MKHIYTVLFFIICFASLNAQVYLDEFDDGVENNVALGNGYTSVEENGEWTITGDGTTGAFELFVLTPNNDDGTPAVVDISGNNRIFVRAKASNLGTQLRMDVRDSDGFATTLAGITKTLINDYTVFEFDYNGNLNDGGFGGTSCTSADAPCPVDPTRIAEFNFYVNPGQGSFAGTVVMDFVAVGEAPGVGPVSDVWQEPFDEETALGYMGSAGPGLANSISGSNWVITGDGTSGPFDPVSLLFFNQTTLDTIDVPVSQGNDKVFIRMRTATPGTTVRLDLQDINDMATTAASITKPITDEWVTYEYNFAGSYFDLGFGGTGCSSDQAPCPVNSDRIANMIVFVNPGAGAFVGDVEIDYISVGTALEEEEEGANDLVYGDHFGFGDGFVNTSASFGLEVSDSRLKITGTGIDGPFAAISYTIHDRDTGEGTSIDVTGNNKFFFRAKSDTPNTLLRVDLIDTSGFITTIPSLTRLIDAEYVTYELDFGGQFLDGGFGGTPCDTDTAPCPVDATAINSVLFYPNPADGGFEGCIEIEFVSFGAPLGDDIAQYSDHFENENRDLFSDAAGFTVEETGTELVIVGDGTAGPFAAFNYSTHNTDDFTPIIVDMTSNNKLYVKARSTVPGTPLRIDLVDTEGFATTNPATVAIVNEEFEILEFDFTGTYTDGGFGGTSCMAGPCPVDGSIVSNFLFYIDPNNGGYNGTMTIDWISTIEPLEMLPGTDEPLGVDTYMDEMEDNSLDFISDQDGLVTEAVEGQLRIIGDGSSGAFAPVLYQMHDGLDSLIVNAESNDNKIYIRARSTVDGLPLRVDVQDNVGFLSSLAGLTQVMTNEFEVYEYDYTGNYQDGGFGGTPCMAGPCNVDGQRLEFLQFYINPGIGAFAGELHIDWISFGMPITSSVLDQEAVSQATIFPNPASDRLYLEMDIIDASRNAQVTMMDVSGRTVLQQSIGRLINGTNRVEIDLEGLENGFHILVVKLDDKSAVTAKVMINN